MSRIDVKIDRVVLRGLDPSDQHSLVSSLKSELSRLLADPATAIKSASSQRIPVARIGRMPTTPGANGTRRLGGSIAGAIAKRIKP